MKTASVCKFTLIALPVSYFVMVIGLTLSHWPLFIYDTSLKPSFQVLMSAKFFWASLSFFLLTAWIEISIWKALIHLKKDSGPLKGFFSLGSKFIIPVKLSLYLFLGIMISYYLYRWHDVFMFYNHELQGDIVLIVGLSLYVISLSFFILTYNKYNLNMNSAQSTAKL